MARRPKPASRQDPEILVITGLSGSGKTHVARALEDLGWFCVDNLPSALIPRFAELIRSSEELRHSALVLDIREPDFLERFPGAFRRLKDRGIAVSLLFLEAEEKALLRRFSETRRPHPLAVNQPVVEGIREESLALRPIRKLADFILDTSDRTVHELRDYVRERFGRAGETAPFVVTVMSFGYKYGLPSEADFVLDVRFLPNPNFVPKLKALTGLDGPVIRYLRRQPDLALYLAQLKSLFAFVIPRARREGKSYLTIAMGCTGGRHRSVMIAETLGAHLTAAGCVVRVRHRDVRQP